MLNVGQALGDQLPKLAVEQHCRIGLYTQQIGGRPSGDFEHEYSISLSWYFLLNLQRLSVIR